MLIAAAVMVALTVLSGATLALLGLRARPSMSAALHGFLAAVGLVLLVFALRGLPRGMETGTANFGIIALVLLGLAAVIGIAMLILHRRRGRLPGLAIGVHATFAVAGFVVLAVYAIL